MPEGLFHRRAFELGRFVELFGYVESAAAEVAWALLGVSHEDGPAVTRPLDLRGTLQLIRALAPAKIEPAIAERVVSWVEQVDSLREKRNELVHSPWLSESVPLDHPPDEVLLRKVDLRKGGFTTGVTLRDTRAMSEKLNDLAVEGGVDLANRIWAIRKLSTDPNASP